MASIASSILFAADGFRPSATSEDSKESVPDKGVFAARPDMLHYTSKWFKCVCNSRLYAHLYATDPDLPATTGTHWPTLGEPAQMTPLWARRNGRSQDVFAIDRNRCDANREFSGSCALGW